MDKTLAKDIMIRDVYVVPSSDKIALARLKMLRHNIGGLPVVDSEGRLVGMITLRDIDLAGNDVSSLIVEELMSTDLITGAEESSAKELAELMLETGVQRIPIVDDENLLIGMVTQTTIIKAATKSTFK